jgi:hypothetical protein
MRLALGIIGLGLLVTPAAGHDQWLNGYEVDPVLNCYSQRKAGGCKGREPLVIAHPHSDI